MKRTYKSLDFAPGGIEIQVLNQLQEPPRVPCPDGISARKPSGFRKDHYFRMVTTLIISLFCLSAVGAYAQSADDEAAERQQIHNKAIEIYCETNGNMPNATMHYKTNYSNVHAAYPDAPVNAIPVWPSGNFVALQEPPCYKYKNADGQWVTECPGARFSPPTCDNPESAMKEIDVNGSMNISSEKSFTGNYPDLRSVYPNAPANAQPAWPSTPYTQLKDPPCYKYINKRGLEVTECPGAQFEPEHSR